jgi:hypothetical protein
MGGTQRIRHRVVDVADVGRRVATGESAAQIAKPDELGQRRRRPIAQLRAGLRHGQRLDLGDTGQLGHECRGHGAKPG